MLAPVNQGFRLDVKYYSTGRGSSHSPIEHADTITMHFIYGARAQREIARINIPRYADGRCTRYVLLERTTPTSSAALAALHDTPLLIGVVYIWGKRGMDIQNMWVSTVNSK